MKGDCHIHMVLDGADWRAAIARHRPGIQEEWIRQTLRIYQGLGYTYLRDGGDRWGVCLRAKQLAKEYGIRYRAPGAPLCKAGHYGRFIGRAFEDSRQFLELVRANREQGCDFVKIMISGLMDFDHCGVLTEPGLSGEEIRELVRMAHGEGLPVMAHANGAETVYMAARAGVDSIEHGAYLDRRALEAMGQAGTIWVPTLSAIGNLRGKGRFSQVDVEKILESAMDNLSAFASMGGKIAPGSDAGAWAVPHGCDTEQALLEQALGQRTQQVLEKGLLALMEKF